MRIHQVNLRVGNRLADGRQRVPRLGVGGQIVRRGHMRFRRAVMVGQTAIGQPLKQSHDWRRCLQLLTRCYQLAQVQIQTRLGGKRFGQLLQSHKRQENAVHLLFSHQAGQPLRIAPDCFINHHQGATTGQRGKNLLTAHVEAEGGELQRFVAHLAVGILQLPRQQIGDGPLLERHTLGLARRARGVDDVNEVIERDIACWVFCTFLGDGGPIAVQANQFSLMRWHSGQQAGLGKQDLCPGVGQHVGQPLLRVSWVQRHVGSARLKDAQQPHQHLQRSLHGERHLHIGADACFLQSVSQLVGAPVQLGIGHGLIGEFGGDGIRGLGSLLFKALVDG